MRLAICLLLIVSGMHYLADPMATGYANKLAAAKAWDYILNGVGAAALFLLVGLLARNALAWPVCVWGMVEEGERSVCRLVKPIGGIPPPTELFSGLCGEPFYAIGLWALICLALYLRGQNERTSKP